MEICKKEHCTGCFACINSCTRNCIEMQEDDLGVMHPLVNTDKCIECGACIRSCPANNETESCLPIKIYAVVNNNHDEILTCATSGMGWLISKHTILNGGTVFATIYDEQLTPRVTEISDIESLKLTKGSKYVQSLVGEGTLLRIRDLLKNEVPVTFIGTPCQAAGVKQFLKRDYPHLLLVDLLCHGVVPTSYFKSEVDYQKKAHQLKHITDVRFRGNDGNNFVFTMWDKQSKIYTSRAYSQPYFAGFLYGTTLRENCFNCRYAKKERVGDITIGDFIGLGASIPFEHKKENVSFLTVNTQKGVDLTETLMKTCPQLHFVERTYEERLAYPYSLLLPTLRHPSVNKFRELYPHYGYVLSVRKALRKQLLKEHIKEYLLWLKPILKLFK